MTTATQRNRNLNPILESVKQVLSDGASARYLPLCRCPYFGLVSFTYPRYKLPLTSYPGSQVPLYFTGGVLSYMAADLGGEALTSSSWIPVCNTLAVASIAPFSGHLADIFGRRNITLIGSLLIMVGLVLTATAHSFAQAIAGMSLAGAGAGIGELTALGG